MCVRSSTEAQFHSWFTQYQSSNLKQKMLRPLRTAVGLGEIPAEYTNNPNESANTRIKAKVDYKKSELRMFCQEMKELVDSQTQHIESAFTMDIGPYAVCDAYCKYKQNPRSWVKESKAYRQRYINQIHKIQLLPRKPPMASSIPATSRSAPSSTSVTSSTSAMSSTSVTSSVSSISSELAADNDIELRSRDIPSDEQKENLVPLTMSWKEVGLSEEVFGGMWEKAARLVADDGSITAAPGLPNAKMVASFSCPQKPHVVAILANGKMTCDCLNFKPKSLCSHTLAVAEKSGALAQLLQWYISTNQSANMWSLACSCDAPKRPGVKPGGNTSKRSQTSLPPLKTCSSRLSTTQAKGTPLSNHSQLPSPQLQKEPGPLSPRAPWLVPSTESHYVGPSHISIGSCESHYAGPGHSYGSPYYSPFQPYEQCVASRIPIQPYEPRMPFQPYQPRMPFRPYQPMWHCTPTHDTVNSSPQTVYEPDQDIDRVRNAKNRYPPINYLTIVMC